MFLALLSHLPPLQTHGNLTNAIRMTGSSTAGGVVCVAVHYAKVSCMKRYASQHETICASESPMRFRGRWYDDSSIYFMGRVWELVKRDSRRARGLWLGLGYVSVWSGLFCIAWNYHAFWFGPKRIAKCAMHFGLDQNAWWFSAMHFGPDRNA